MRHLFVLGLLSFVVCVPSTVRAEEPAAPFEVEVHKDIAYNDAADADPVKHKLDLFLPKGQKDYPVLFFVHGGAWSQGDKGFLNIYSNIGKAFARQGIGAVVISYRLSPKVKHPAHIEDVALAYAWAQKNIGKYGGKADQMFVCGHSAGGHLVALLVTDERYLKAHGLSPKDVRGAIPISGVYDIPARMLPAVFGTDAEVKKQASPLRQVKAGLPPFCILYADEDLPGCGKMPSEAFATALREQKITVETHEIKESNHMKIIMSASNRDDIVFKTALEFIRAQTAKK